LECRLGKLFFSVKRSNTKAEVIRQSLKPGMPALRTRLGKRPRRRLSLVEPFKRLKGLELPPYLDE